MLDARVDTGHRVLRGDSEASTLGGWVVADALLGERAGAGGGGLWHWFSLRDYHTGNTRRAPRWVWSRGDGISGGGRAVPALTVLWARE